MNKQRGWRTITGIFTFTAGVAVGLFGSSSISDIFKRNNREQQRSSVAVTTDDKEDKHTIITPRDQYEVTIPNIPEHFDKYGLPKSESIISRSSYVTSINYGRRQPNWVLEVMNRESLEHNVDREHTTFITDTDVPRLWRARNLDYLNSGYARGHLVPAADSRTSQQALKDTFLLSSNIIPQDAKNNMLYWSRVEAFARSLILENEFKEAYIMTGPIWTYPDAHIEKPSEANLIANNDNSNNHDNNSNSNNANIKTRNIIRQVSYPVIGESTIHVPTHIFKAILAIRQNEDKEEPYFAAFVVPNAPIPPSNGLLMYKVSRSRLDSLLGFRVFPRLEGEKDLCVWDVCRLGRNFKRSARVVEAADGSTVANA
ncbi:hypothetical protein SmJEL517_g00260 [Synchytrium microbalum]|uniref:Endonuclease n=1 Tax=Synchytrium microbalum TaxID=1806994 RepID=A0A507CF88_9FUNG|nr:uncharacterized protein SmJEL517_g00260 [Synchytrium microbalum]TPX38161.1 hypothetical protein SmJEL517_g00260 [Synchytrium microbalum]